MACEAAIIGHMVCCLCNSSDFLAAFTGSTTSSSLLFVFPGILYLKINNRRFKTFDSIGVTTQIYQIHKIFVSFQSLTSVNTLYYNLFILMLFVLFVSLGCCSCGVWFDHGSLQLHSHCHLMGADRLILDAPPLSQIKQEQRRETTSIAFGWLYISNS